MNKTNEFRKLHSDLANPLVLANVWDAAGARLVESLGGKAVATTSAGFAWSKGYRDGNSLPAKLQAGLATEILGVVNIPVSIDFEAGYSDNPEEVAANLRPLVEAGISGIDIEDGTDAPELLGRKIEAIKKMVATAGADVFVNARTDVFLQGLVEDERMVDEVLARAAIYRAAGADGLFAPAVKKAVDIEAIAAAVPLPLNILLVPGLPDFERLAGLGVRRLSAGSGIALAVHGEFARLTQSFLQRGNLGELAGSAMSYAQLQGLFNDRT